ncbi:hypothetical protein HAX54_047095, partial [Datura stramonium]|nr:hypothetical protein [Datura stramonium]
LKISSSDPNDWSPRVIGYTTSHGVPRGDHWSGGILEMATTGRPQLVPPNHDSYSPLLGLTASIFLRIY